MNGMAVYDLVRIERELDVKGANPRRGLKVETEPRRRLLRRRVTR